MGKTQGRGIPVMSEKVRVNAAFHPFKAERNIVEFDFDPELTVGEILRRMRKTKIDHASAFVKGAIIPRDRWDTTKLNAGDLVEVRAYPVPRGGGGGKNVLNTILSIAVIALAFWAGPVVAGWFFTAATPAWATAVATSVFATVGMLAVNALVPVSRGQMEALSSTAGERDSPTLFIEGARNSVSPFSPIPQLLGKYRMYPPLGSKPYTEIIGDSQYLRMLFVWGIGPVDIDLDTIKIGDTLISEYEGVQMEHRYGYSGDSALTLFPSTINQENLSIAVTQAVGWITRTSAANADELSVDFLFPKGLVQFDNQGNRMASALDVEIEYRAVGAGTWSKIDTSAEKFQTTIPSSSLIKDGDDLDHINFRHARTSAVIHGIRWPVSSRGQYEIRIRKTSVDYDLTTLYEDLSWSALRTITIDDPVDMPVPIAMTALVIKATDQLNGVIDQLNAIVTVKCKDWNATTEVWDDDQPTQNPASLFRHVLQGSAIAVPLPDSRIDLDALQDWHEFCEEKGFKFNMVRDYSSSVWQTLRDIAAAGRAVPTMVDGKWSVAIDQQQDAPVSFITPRNSYGFRAEKFFLNTPHAWRIEFPNENEGYSFDERRVYADGYDESTATKFETLEILGVTDPDQIYRLGRYRLAQAIHQPERWTFSQDMEFLTYRRGDRVGITHDVLLVGLAYGRVKEVNVNSDDEVTSITLDEAVTMEADKDYGVVVRNIENAALTAQVVTAAGTTTELTFVTPIATVGSDSAQAILPGDMCGFGILGEESDDATIISIVPSNDFKAQVVAVPYREEIYDADTEDIPEFDTKVTALTPIPAPTVGDVVSDESAMVRDATGGLRVRIAVNYKPLNAALFGVYPTVQVQMRDSTTQEPFYNAKIEDETHGQFFIGDVRTGEVWDIRLRFVVPNRLPGPWVTIASHQVVGKSTPPAALQNMTISAIGGQAMIRWDMPAEIDVIFGGQVVFRHSQALTGATWGSSVSIGQAAMARTLFAVLPLKVGTYFARVYDVDGNVSAEISTVTTKQVSVLTFTSADDIDEASAFLGTKDGLVVEDSALKIDETLYDSDSDSDSDGERALEGEYEFLNSIDLGSVQHVRLTTRITSSIYLVNDTIDSRTARIDTWESFDGSNEAAGDARVYVRHTDDDPSGTPTWSAWNRLDSAEFEARAFQFKAVLSVDSEDYNINVTELGVDADQVT